MAGAAGGAAYSAGPAAQFGTDVLELALSGQSVEVAIEIPGSGSHSVQIVGHAAAMRRALRRSRLARPYIWRLMSLSQFILPSTWPQLETSIFRRSSFGLNGDFPAVGAWAGLSRERLASQGSSGGGTSPTPAGKTGACCAGGCSTGRAPALLSGPTPRIAPGRTRPSWNVTALAARPHHRKLQGRPMLPHIRAATASRSSVRAEIEHVFAQQKGPRNRRSEPPPTGQLDTPLVGAASGQLHSSWTLAAVRVQ